MSYTPNQVYFPSATTFSAIEGHLAEQEWCSVQLSSASSIRVLVEGTEIRLDANTASHVAIEANELQERAMSPHAKRCLGHAGWRVEIAPQDPRVDPDDCYNALLMLYESLSSMPGAVGLDPFDGSFLVKEA